MINIVLLWIDSSPKYGNIEIYFLFKWSDFWGLWKYRQSEPFIWCNISFYVFYFSLGYLSCLLVEIIQL